MNASFNIKRISYRDIYHQGKRGGGSGVFQKCVEDVNPRSGRKQVVEGVRTCKKATSHLTPSEARILHLFGFQDIDAMLRFAQSF